MRGYLFPGRKPWKACIRSVNSTAIQLFIRQGRREMQGGISMAHKQGFLALQDQWRINDASWTFTAYNAVTTSLKEGKWHKKLFFFVCFWPTWHNLFFFYIQLVYRVCSRAPILRTMSKANWPSCIEPRNCRQQPSVFASEALFIFYLYFTFFSRIHTVFGSLNIANSAAYYGSQYIIRWQWIIWNVGLLWMQCFYLNSTHDIQARTCYGYKGINLN